MFRSLRYLSLAAGLLMGVAAVALVYVYRQTATTDGTASIFALVVAVMLMVSVALYAMAHHGERLLSSQQGALLEAQAELDAARLCAQQAALAKTKFLANMSHEIRTPMNGILGMTDLLMHTPLADTQIRYAQTITRSGQALMNILNDILDLSKIESGKLELDNQPFDVGDAVRETCDLMAAGADEQGLELAVDIADGLNTRMLGDAVRFRQVLGNLLDNAIKFTHEGKVGISLRAEPALGPGGLRVTVADTGIGIAPELQDQLFEPFLQGDSSTTRNFGGTGLGLTIARQLVELMGGRIDLRSTPREGSEFSFTVRFEPLPAAQAVALRPARAEPRPGAAALPAEAANDPAVAHAAAPPPPLVRDESAPARDVLLVEDNMVNVLYAQAVLTALDCRVTVATDGKASLEKLREQRFDLILMDCHMPGMDGFTATPLIRVLEAQLGRPATPIVALTASAMSEDREHCMAVGMDDFIAKPFQPADLRRALERWAGAG
jgi:signal transduction histidine kinase/ActR/RegA family two-component response regulator